MNRLFDILGALVGVAMVTTLVSHQNTASVLTAGGNAFSGAVKASEGR